MHVDRDLPEQVVEELVGFELFKTRVFDHFGGHERVRLAFLVLEVKQLSQLFQFFPGHRLGVGVTN